MQRVRINPCNLQKSPVEKETKRLRLTYVRGARLESKRILPPR